MHKRWISYYFFLLLSLIFALLYPGCTSSAIFYALLLTPLLSLGFSALLLPGFRYEQHIDTLAAGKGETVHYRLTAGNRGALMLPYVELRFYGAGEPYQAELAPRRLAIPPHGRASVDIPLPCRYKGAFEMGVRQIIFHDFLGLFTFKKNMEKLGDLVVFPRIVPLDAFPVMAGYDGDPGETAGHSPDRTENISDIRKYTRGDRLRAIHWKLSAKKEELMVKNFEQASGASMALIINASGDVTGMEAMELEDRLIECAVAILYFCARHSIRTDLHFMGGALTRQRVTGMNDFESAFRLLAETTVRMRDRLPGVSALMMDEGARRKTVAYVTAELTETVAAELLAMRENGYDIVVVHTPPHGRDEDADTAKLADALRNSGARCITVYNDTDISAACAREAV